MGKEFVRIVVVPFGITFFVFVFEWFAITARGLQKGKQKYKAWLKEPDGDTYAKTPIDLTKIIENVVRYHSKVEEDALVDITELVSFDGYSGIAFDLVAAALASDLLAAFQAHDKGIPTSTLVFWPVIHLLLLALIAILIRANNLAEPTEENSTNQPQVNHEQRRTLVAIGIGLFAIVTSFIFFWSAL